jgi:hypothetical protein
VRIDWVVTVVGCGCNITRLNAIVLAFTFVHHPLARSWRSVTQCHQRRYFPRGCDWTHHYTGKVYKGGTTAVVQAPLDSLPLFKRTTLQSAHSQE